MKQASRRVLFKIANEFYPTNFATLAPKKLRESKKLAPIPIN